MQATVPTEAHNPSGYTATQILDGLRGRTGTRRWTFRYELLDSDNAFVQHLDNVVDCKVEQNWLADIKRTATFQVREVDYIDYLSDRIKPYARLHLPPFAADSWVEWPQGLFILSTPTRSSNEQGLVTRQVDGYDLLQVLTDDISTDRYTVTAGTAYTTAVQALLPAGAAFNIATSTATVPVDIDWEPGVSTLKRINELLGAINYESISVTEDGVYQVQPYTPPPSRPDEYVYGADADGLVIPHVDQTLDLFSIPNRWVLCVSEPDRDPITATYTNTDPASLTSTIRRSRVITDFRTEQEAADQAVLDAKVERLAFEASQVYEAIDFNTALMPIHSGNDIYRIRFPDLAIDASYSEHRWTMPLRAGAAMTHRARRVLSLAV